MKPIKSNLQNRTILVFATLFLLFSNVGKAQTVDSLRYPFKKQSGGIYLESPMGYYSQYDPQTGNYILRQKIGNVVYGDPIILTQEQYMDMLLSRSMGEYYKQKSKELDKQYRSVRYGEGEGQEDKGLVLPSLQIKNKIFENIFGGDKIELVPKGYASVDLGIYYQNLENPQILPQNRRSFAIDLQQRIQMGVVGKIGKNLELAANYDTQAGFGFENRMNLAWKPNGKGGEDNIIQNIEFGNVSMPLSTSIITGTQSLFGAKTEIKFGNTYITSVFSQQESEARHITVKGGGAVSTFKIYAKDYDVNQHYFLSQFFRGKYDGALANYPFISSQININRLEIWVIDKSNANQDTKRAMIALRDLGDDGNSYPNNGALYNKLAKVATIRNVDDPEAVMNSLGLKDKNGNSYASGEHYLLHQNVRKLSPSEYQFFPELGYFSLNQPLNDSELLAVSFQYTLTNQPGKLFTVGEFSDQQSDLLITKLIKSNANVNPKSPMWDLMMKNIYSLNTYQLSREDFRLNIFYQDPEVGTAGLNYLQGTKAEDKTLLQTLNMDRLNMNGEVQKSGDIYGDGLFDFVNGITIDAQNGKIKFTTIEPFAKTVQKEIGKDDPKYVLNQLYNDLPINFEQNPAVKRYYLEGQFKSEGGDGIPLGAFNVPQGSVKVTSNGVELMEGLDYTVDYQLGRVKIINEVIKNSGAPVNVSLENRSTFNLQTKRLLGVNVEHKFSDRLRVGATYMNYRESLPGLGQKAQYNAEPVNNSIFGANVMYNGESNLLTRLTDKIPFVDTDAKSNISFIAEGAYLQPGTNKSTENQSYIDDFEGALSRINLDDVNSWKLAATPISTSEMPNPDFPESIFNPDDFSFNYNRRMLSWYNIDPRFYGLGGASPISNAELSNNASRRVETREIFTGKEILVGTSSFVNTFDLTFYPEDRGPYNLNPQWQGEKQENLWAGITRALNVTNLRQANIEYIEFWMMDPYLDGASDSPEGKIMLQLGSVSEDVLRDGKMLYENGINEEGNPDRDTKWGRVPKNTPILYSFQTEGVARELQDVGYNGLTNEQERVAVGYSNFANEVNPLTQQIDPAGDDFVYYMDEVWKGKKEGSYLPNRYKYFRNPQGNSRSGTTEVSSLMPDSEDVNLDYNLERVENYNQYTVPLDKANLNINNKFIVDVKETRAVLENGQTVPSKWYLFRVPIDEYDKQAGAASDNVLTSARFMRLIVKGFKEQMTFRFGSLDMVRSNWVRYKRNLYPNVKVPEGEQSLNTNNLTVGVVNLEENGTGNPPYVVPPGIARERVQTTAGMQNQNEASMVLNVSELEKLDSRAVFKNTNLDLRRFKQLKMFTHVHTENRNNESNNLKLFIRLGSDLVENYYEYELPLKYTPIGAISPTEIWPEQNIIDVATEQFVKAKEEAYSSSNTNDRYPFAVDAAAGKMIYVKGKPSLGNISTIMIGVRNSGNIAIKDAVIWVNELRLSGIKNEGGYAASANLNFNLGDLAQVNASGRITSVGFGAIDRGPVERQQEEIKGYAINTVLNVDKFLPKKWGLKIPFNYAIQEEFIDPKYNPLDNDVEMQKSPNRDEISKIVGTYSKNVTYGFSNVRKERTNPKKEARFYDIENFSLSGVYNSNYYRDIYTVYDLRQNLRASLNYNYSFKSKYYEPFKDWYMVNDTAQSARYLQWVKEFNFNPIPSRLSFRTDVLRTYNEQQYRDINSYLIKGATPINFNTNYGNNFLFSWQYNVGFDLTKSLRLDYTASTRTLANRIKDEPDQNLIFKDLLQVGMPVNYNQQFQVNWKTPIRLLPYMEWADVEMGYTAVYDWQARLSNYANVDGAEQNLGNKGQNAQTLTAIGNLDFSKLYDQFEFIRKVNIKRDKRQAELDSIQNVYQDLAKAKNGLQQIRKRKIKVRNKLSFSDYLVLAVQSIKRGQFNYNKTSGIILPGLLAEPNFVGIGQNNLGPNAAFIFGSQADIRRTAVENGWITRSDYLTEPYASNITENLMANIQVEPIPELMIDFNARKNYVRNMLQSGFNTYIGLENGQEVFGFEKAYENTQENLTLSIISLGATFSNKEDLYRTLKQYSKKISLRQGEKYGLNDTDADGYAQGYGISNADVLVPAFLKAYQGLSLPNKSFDFKQGIPLPNWNITYTGLTKNPFMSKFFERFDVTHNYISTKTVSGVQSNLNRFSEPLAVDSNGRVVTDRDGNPTSGIDGNNNIYSENTYGAVSIVESFSPLIGVDATLRNNMQIRAQYNRDRLVSLSLSNYTLTEDYGSEFVVGLGYILKDVTFKMRYMGKRRTIKGDLNLRADLAMRDNEISIRRILTDDVQINGGQKIFSLKFNAQYMFSKNFNVSLFYDQMITKYKISTAYPLSTLRAGISATFTLGN
ncbi:cell surface protein SprA [Weeksellaceae bacterium TAE3-ERU29]|nr:cell surface protein SprA [Weeksellaceae bacterium TAE3-ERU29]